MKKRITYSLFITLLIVISCVKEDHFQFSDRASIIGISVSNQNGISLINDDLAEVRIDIANGSDLSSVELLELDLSSFATASIVENEILDFSNDSIDVIITAENGNHRTWTIYAYEIGSTPQLPNSDFNQWYNFNDSYLELGEDEATTIWGTSNPGVEFGAMDANVIQEEISTDDYAIKMITRFSNLNAIFNKPIAAGSAFLGKFNIKDITINDPEAAIDFGFPFTATPIAFSIDYAYTPGPKNIDQNSNTLPFEDSADIYILLERREDGMVKRVATAWFRTDDDTPNLTNITIPFTYGELPASAPSYTLPQGTDTYAQQGEAPTHIKVVFSSSANGNLFQGAKNSTLLIDNLILIY